jgi:alcohol dehydrogenase class IV
MEQFHYISYAQEVIFGTGSLARLSEALDGFKAERLLLCSSHSARSSGLMASIETTLGTRLAAVVADMRPHVQDVQLAEILALAVENEVDAVIGLGGGSPLGMAKAVASALEEKRSGHPARAAFPTDQPLVPVIAIPTTYAGSEMTPMYGITHTDEIPPRKVTVNDPKIAPKLVIYDPELTLNLPPELTASTGINALAHCIEALYSKTRNPLSTAAAVSAMHLINAALYRCYENGNDLEARTEMLLGAHLAGLSLASVTMGLHHGLCHVLGGSANVPHGIANSIILPHAIRFNAEATAPQLLPAAEAMGISLGRISPTVAIETMAQRIFELIGRMNLPQRLRDTGVGLKDADLAGLAQIGFQNRSVQNNPKGISDAKQIETLLKVAW